MASVTQKVPNYVLGISTQPDSQKAPGQVVDLVNGLPDIVQNLMKRPGSQLISTLTPNTAANSKWFDIYTNNTEQYIGQVAADGELKIWRASDGAVIPVDTNEIGTPGGAATYLKLQNQMRSLLIYRYLLLTKLLSLLIERRLFQ